MTRPYRTRDELRQLMVDEGTELLLEMGLPPQGITFASVFERISNHGQPRVTRGSVVGPGRLWPSQRDFQSEVEANAVRRWAYSPLEIPTTLAAAADVLSSADLRSIDGRRAAVRELCRRAGQANFEASRGSRLWKLVIALWSRESMQPQERQGSPLLDVIEAATRHVTNELVDKVYRPLADAVGYRGRAEFGGTEEALRLLAASAYALNDGMVLRSDMLADPDLSVYRRSGEGAVKWSVFTVALEALIHQFLEPIPRWRPGAGERPA